MPRPENAQTTTPTQIAAIHKKGSDTQVSRQDLELKIVRGSHVLAQEQDLGDFAAMLQSLLDEPDDTAVEGAPSPFRTTMFEELT